MNVCERWMGIKRNSKVDGTESGLEAFFGGEAYPKAVPPIQPALLHLLIRDTARQCFAGMNRIFRYQLSSGSDLSPGIPQEHPPHAAITQIVDDAFAKRLLPV